MERPYVMFRFNFLLTLPVTPLPSRFNRPGLLAAYLVESRVKTRTKISSQIQGCVSRRYEYQGPGAEATVHWKDCVKKCCCLFLLRLILLRRKSCVSCRRGWWAAAALAGEYRVGR